MHLDLPSGHKAEIRDQLLGGDRRAAKKAIKVVVGEDGSRTVVADLEENVKYALLTRMVVFWDYPDKPLPCKAVDPDGVLDSLPDEDLEVLMDAVQPAYDRFMGRDEGNPKTTLSSASD